MIVVTGSSGVLGKALVDGLVRRGERVVSLASSDVDLRDRERTIDTISALKPDTVYHLAAKVHGLGGNAAFQAEMFSDNVRINMNVIDASLLAGCQKFIGVSTVAIYSSEAERPVKEVSIWDGPPHRSERAYGQAKRAMLAQLEAYEGQYGMSFAYPIMTNIYGPYDRFDPLHGHVIPSLIAKFYDASRNGNHVDVWGTGKAERDFIFSEDAANALIGLATHTEGPINVATGSTIPIRRIVEILSDHARVYDVRWDDSKPDGQLERSYDVSRLSATGFTPQIPIEDGLRATFDWYSANYDTARR